MADKVGLKVLLRPSPYICSEWDFGGLPWWLLRYPDIQLRCSDQKYMKFVERYYYHLCKEFVPLLSTNGGPIIAVAIENEYGSFGNDKVYLEYLKKLLIENQVDVPLYTTDGSADHHLVNGTLKDVWKAVNFRLDVEHSLGQLRKHQPDKPLFVGEFWSGRSSHWGEEYSPRDIDPVAEAFEKILEMGSNVCFYMFSGGTNFGFMNGANFDSIAMQYRPLVTSYDVDALLTEYGQPTEKYYACQKVLAKHLGKPIVSSEPVKRIHQKHLVKSKSIKLPIYLKALMRYLLV
jgi:beta-galactosidase